MQLFTAASSAVLAAALLTAAPSVAAAPKSHAMAKPAAASARIVLPAEVSPSAYRISVRTDAEKLTFSGKVAIDIQVAKATKTIKLNQADLKFTHVALSGVSGEPTIAYDEKQETATLTFAQTITPGAKTLSIDYTGKINRNAAGLFALDYVTADGASKRALFTQFENSDFRRFVPSWDEPAHKATFELDATIPKADFPISNMPVASTTDAGGGYQTVHFGKSPKMSSYLVYFGAGDFERIHTMVDGIDVGVITRKGQAENGRYALEAAAKLLPFYNQYFGVKYPLPKLDLIAGPGQSQFFSAMENWGAILYFETVVLLDPKISTEGNRQTVFSVIAHEMAHQWFGDLVTMQWWDDLWLNEGFASWMAAKATDHFNPAWNAQVQELGGKQGAMRLDAQVGTHPVIAKIRDVLEANQAFDTITYQKGQAVITMLEAYAGEDAWRAGVRNYMAKHKYSNTVTDDLWKEIDAVSPKKVTQIAHDFTLQSGVPLITVTPNGKAGFTLTQGRFGVDEVSKEARTWTTPVVVGPANASYGASATKTVVVSAGKPVTVQAFDGPAVLVNKGQSGYFRTAYAPSAFAGIVRAYPTLSAADQTGVLSDAWALGEAGYVPVSEALDLTLRTPANADPVVLSNTAAVVTAVAGYFDDTDPGRPALNAYVRKALTPLYQRLGWDAKPGEAANDGLLRGQILQSLGAAGDEAVMAEARKRFETLKSGGALPPATRQTVVGLVSRNATPAEWEALHAMARASKNQQEKAQLYQLLGNAKDDALAQRALDLSVSGEPPVTVTPSILRQVSGKHHAMAFDFYVAHLDAYSQALEADSRNQMFPRLVAGSTDPALLDKLEAYAKAKMPETAQGDVKRTLAASRNRIRIKAQRAPEILKWVQAHG